MKTLMLIRHADSRRAAAGEDDFDRPLSARGVAAARRVAAHLRDHGAAPDLILCSSARRARETLAAVLAGLVAPPAVDLGESLYLAPAAALAKAMRGLDDSRERVLLVGHNPGLEELAVTLTGAALPAPFPAGALAVIELPAMRWADLAAGSGTLRAFVVPDDDPPPTPA